MKFKMINKIFRFAVLALMIHGTVMAQTEQKRELPQFLFEKFTRGIVRMKAGNNYTANLNYNMVDEEMVFEQKGNYLVLDKPQDIDTVYLQNRLFVPVEKAFYEVVSKGNVTIFIQHKARYAPVASNTAYGMKSQTLGPSAVPVVRGGNQFRSLDMPDNVTVSQLDMNWVRKGGSLEKFNNASQFIKLFPEKENELKQFIKSNKLDLKVREDIVKLGKYCNEIIK